MLARGGQLDEAQRCSTALRPLLPDLVRDGYWLATLSMVADTCHRTGDAAPQRSSLDLLTPAIDLTITDPGLIYRGAAAHFAGLAASVLGRTDLAVELLRTGLATHERHGSTWMAARSHAALDRYGLSGCGTPRLRVERELRQHVVGLPALQPTVSTSCSTSATGSVTAPPRRDRGAVNT